MMTAMAIVGFVVSVPLAVFLALCFIGGVYEKAFSLLKINGVLIQMLIHPTQKKLAAELAGLRGVMNRCINLESRVWRYQKCIVHMARHHPSENVRKLAYECCDYSSDEQWAPLARKLGMEEGK